MNNENNLSEQQPAEIKKKIKKAIASYLLNNKDDNKKANDRDDFISEIIHIVISCGLSENSPALRYFVSKICDSISVTNESLDTTTEQLYISINNYNPYAAATELVLEETQVEPYDHENDLEL